MIPSLISTSGRFDVSTFPDPSLPCSLVPSLPCSLAPFLRAFVPSCLRAFLAPCLPRSVPPCLVASMPRCLFSPLTNPPTPVALSRRPFVLRKRTQLEPKRTHRLRAPSASAGSRFRAPSASAGPARNLVERPASPPPVPRFQSPKRQRGACPKPQTTDRTTPTWPRRSEPRPPGSGPPSPRPDRHGTGSTSRHSPFAFRHSPPGPVHVPLAICRSLLPGPAGPEFGRISLDGGRGQAP
jgi:hypothetical protein